MKLPLGDSDFRNILREGFRDGLVDKTLFIRDVIDGNAKTALISRPRRFGKTLNMSMLRHFFDIRAAKENRPLFADMKIANAKTLSGQPCIDYQGKYPVIYMTLKSLRSVSTFTSAKERLVMLIGEVYGQHRYLLESDLLLPDEKKIFQTIIDEQVSTNHLISGFKKLAELLYRYYHIDPVILIDEYDAPFHASYLAEPKYYPQMIELLGGFFGETFKDNEHLFKGLMTGILRISLLNLFSGNNNVPVYSVLKPEYASYFGFTEKEVLELLVKTGLKNKFGKIKSWYNGYEIGGVVIYNPWSIINCLAEGGNLESYWVASAGTDSIIRDNLRQQGIETKQALEKLMQREIVEVEVSERTLFANLATDTAALWGLLIYAGYLKVLKVITRESTGALICAVQIPNLEVLREYFGYVQIWNEEALGRSEYHAMLQHLVTGNVPAFQSALQNYIERTASYFDFNPKTTEQVYHVFLLGLIAGLDNKYFIQSNRESGEGRFDIVLIPKSVAQPQLGIVMEFKSAASGKSLKIAAGKALQQIRDKKYTSIFKPYKLANTLRLGIAFSGKKVCILTGKK